MDKLRRYIISNLSLLFFSIFLPLFAIASVIFMIKMATYTAVIQLSVLEMGKLYLFVLPQLFFYTLPIAFVVAATLALYRLSQDNEMVVVFSLGISPRFLIRTLAKPAFLLSILLFVDYLVVTPYITVISGNFVQQRKSEAQFNLSASEFGHNFGDWMLFVNKSDNANRLYGDVVLFNKNMKDEILIRSNTAELINNGGLLQLKLTDGKSYSYADQSFKEMHFKHLFINDILTTDPEPYIDTFDYWTNQDRRTKKDQLLITNTLLSLFPLISLFLIVALGIVHARHQKRWIYLWLFVSLISFYAAAIVVQKWAGFHTIYIVAISWIVVTYLFYRRLVGQRF